MVRVTLFIMSRESAGVTLPLEFRINFQAFSQIKCNIGKYTRMFVPLFPGTSGQTFWYISLKAMKYLYNIYSLTHAKNKISPASCLQTDPNF